MLVAPVLAPGGNQAIWLPPGQWLDFFTGARYAGDRTFTAHYAVDQTPVFVHDGALVPQQPVSAFSDEKPLDRLIINVYGADQGAFDLYEDDGSSLRYDEPGQHAHTAITHAVSSDGAHRVVIEPVAGSYPGQPPERAYELRIFGGRQPSAVSVNGVSGHWSWDAEHTTAVIPLSRRPLRERVSVEWH